jgi:hypothetical protein
MLSCMAYSDHIMKCIAGIVLLFCFSNTSTAQINSDSLPAQLNKYWGYIITEQGDTIWSKGHESERAVIISIGGFEKARDTATWDGRWLNYLERESLRIGNEVIKRHDTAIIKFEVLLNFSFNEDKSITDLAISCSPDNDFIKTEFRKLVLAAPKKTPVYRNGNFVRTRISQPLSIKTR